MLEKTLERKCVNWIEGRGGACLKVHIDGQRGFMDRLVLLDGLVCFVELKIPGGKGRLSPQQIEWMNVMKRLNLNAFFCDDFNYFIEKISLLQGKPL